MFFFIRVEVGVPIKEAIYKRKRLQTNFDIPLFRGWYKVWTLKNDQKFTKMLLLRLRWAVVGKKYIQKGGSFDVTWMKSHTLLFKEVDSPRKLESPYSSLVWCSALGFLCEKYLEPPQLSGNTKKTFSICFDSNPATFDSSEILLTSWYDLNIPWFTEFLFQKDLSSVLSPPISSHQSNQ